MPPPDKPPRPRKPPPPFPSLRRAWTRRVPPRARLPTAVVALAVGLLAVVVAPIFYLGYMRAGGPVVRGARVGAWDVGYPEEYRGVFRTPNDLLAAAPFSRATMTMLKPAFRPRKQPAVPPDTPPAAFDAYILALTYLPKFEGASASSPPLTRCARVCVREGERASEKAPTFRNFLYQSTSTPPSPLPSPPSASSSASPFTPLAPTTTGPAWPPAAGTRGWPSSSTGKTCRSRSTGPSPGSPSRTPSSFPPPRAPR